MDKKELENLIDKDSENIEFKTINFDKAIEEIDKLYDSGNLTRKNLKAIVRRTTRKDKDAVSDYGIVKFGGNDE